MYIHISDYNIFELKTILEGQGLRLDHPNAGIRNQSKGERGHCSRDKGKVHLEVCRRWHVQSCRWRADKRESLIESVRHDWKGDRIVQVYNHEWKDCRALGNRLDNVMCDLGRNSCSVPPSQVGICSIRLWQFGQLPQEARAGYHLVRVPRLPFLLKGACIH